MTTCRASSLLGVRERSLINSRDITFFVQGTSLEHNPQIFEQIALLATWDPAQIGYLSLATLAVDGRKPIFTPDESYRCTLASSHQCRPLIRSLGFVLDDDPAVPNDGCYRTYCCGLFAVTRERIRWLPKSTWRLLLKLSYESQVHMGAFFAPLSAMLLTRPLSWTVHRAYVALSPW